MIETLRELSYLLAGICVYLICFTSFFQDLGDAIASRIKHGRVPPIHEEEEEEEEEEE